jgi:aminocarboxymuconate-semialdehyde decarboxylase
MAVRKCAPAKPKRWRTIDIHCHCMVPEANALVLKPRAFPAAAKRRTPTRMSTTSPKVSSRSAARSTFPKLTDLDTRLADMDRDGIDVQVISPYPAISSMPRRRKWRAIAATWSTITSPVWLQSIPID